MYCGYEPINISWYMTTSQKINKIIFDLSYNCLWNENSYPTVIYTQLSLKSYVQSNAFKNVIGLYLFPVLLFLLLGGFSGSRGDV